MLINYLTPAPAKQGLGDLTPTGRSRSGGEVQSLWESYWANRIERFRDRLVRYYDPFVLRMRRAVVPVLPPCVQEEDLIQEGRIRLVRCVEEFSCERRVTFESYAGPHLRGAMLTYLRDDDWVPRSVRRKHRLLAENEMVAAVLAHGDQGDQTDPQLAERLGMSLEQFYAFKQRATIPQVVSLDTYFQQEREERSGEYSEPLADEVVSDDEDPSWYALQSEQRGVMRGLVSQLREPHRTVMALYYYHGMSLEQIGRRIGKTACRACQIHRNGLALLAELIREEDAVGALVVEITLEPGGGC